MIKRIAFLRPFFVALTVLALCFSAFADVIRLKNGSLIKGRIVSFGDGRFVVVMGEGARRREMTFMADEVDSIQFDGQQAAVQSSPQVVNTSAPRDTNPRVATNDNNLPAVDRPAPTSNPPVNTAPRTNAQPISLSVKVLADNTANGWTNSGWVVKRGQRIKITGTGEISLGGGQRTRPSGRYDVDDASKLLKSVPTGALIAVIGDDNNDFIYIGSEREFTAERDGSLFLGVNEGNLNDNSGSFDVKVEIMP